MPYNIVNPGSVEDAWKEKSIMDMVNSQVAQQQPTDEEAFARQVGLYHNIPVDYRGNINLANRPMVQNPDGSVSTVRSMSFNEDGKEVLVPTVSQNGANLTQQRAIDEYHRTGQHLGLFDSPATATAMAQRIHDQQAVGYGNASGNIPTQPATEVVTQGTTRKPTTAEYQAYVIDYLAKKGYSYDSAMKLMRPSIEAYAAQEQAENRATADSLISSMQNMRIDSPEYRQAAFQLYKLNPQMGQFMLKEGIGPREQYLYGRKLSDLAAAQQQRRSDAVFNNDLRFSNFVKQREWADAYAQKQMDARYQWAKSRGADDQSAMAFAMGSSGGRRNASGTSATAGTVTKDDYKQAVEGKKALLAQIEERRMTDPTYHLSPYEQELYNMYDTVERKHNAEYAQRNGYGQQQPKQPVKINPNDYNSVGPFIQYIAAGNNGKIDKDRARFIRKYLGFSPDDTSENNFINQILKKEYGFSG
jgi:hypothetical protein